MLSTQKVIMMGGTGAVGTQVVKQLLNEHSALEQLSLLGRRRLEIAKVSKPENSHKVVQHEIDIFQPSMIITPSNRYGLSQAITLAVWPLVSKFMFGGLSKYRGVNVDVLGQAIANNSFDTEQGINRYQWSDFQQLIKCT